MHLHLRKATEQTMYHRPAASPPQLHETQSMELSNAAVRVAPWVTAHRHLQPRNLANRQARPDGFRAAVQLRTASAQLLVRLVLMCAVPTLPAHPRLQPRDSANCQVGL